jgi:L-threonylcarbamoyladenylate synthase
MSRFGILPASAQHLASRYLPGPLTLVLEAVSDLKPPLVIDSRIGLRVSSSSIIQSLLSMASFPLTATSANISGAEEPDSIASVMEAFGHHVDLYLDGGMLREPVSTVVDCYGGDVKILREGAISRSAIETCLGELPA